MSKYGFYDRLTEDFPSQVIVDLCEVCNYECIHCPQVEFKKSGLFTGAYFDEEMNKKMVDEIAMYGIGKTQQIRYTAAGEPLLHPKLIEILKYAVENSKTFVSLTTNGSLMTQQMIEDLLDMQIGLIDFSLDAFHDDTYAEIRRKGNLKIVRENVLHILKRRKEKGSKTKIVVSFVEQEKNIAERDEFKKYWEEQGIDFVVLRKCHSAGGYLYHKSENVKIQPCVYPWERLELKPNGSVEFCSTSWFNNTVICDNFNTSTIRDIWNGPEYKQLRKEHLENKFEKYTVCADCPDRGLTIWPSDKTKTLRGYGDMIKDFSKQGE